MVGYYMGADDNPQCISIDDGGDVTTSRCEGATGLICGRAIASKMFFSVYSIQLPRNEC